MKLKDIIQDADLYMPNALSNEQKVRYFNQIQRQLYRDFPAALQAEHFITEPGISLYSLSVQPENVVNVYIDGKEYPLKFSQDSNSGEGYMFLNDELFVQPTPQSTKNAYILYKGEPWDMSVNDLEIEPVFLKDYHELFSLGIAQKIALISGKYKEAGELELRFRSLEQDASVKTQKGKLKKVRTVRGWS